MKTRSHSVPFFLIAALTLAAALPGRSQVIPTTPTKFSTRELGDRGSGNSSVGATVAKPQTTARTVTHIVLGAPRQWKMTDGKFFVGKLIAFEDLVVETKLEKGIAPAPAAPPTLPEKPTVVRDGKARLLVDAKCYDVPLTLLGEEERRAIEQVRVAMAAKK